MALKLHRKGLVSVRPLEGGLDGWRDRGLPLVTEAVADGAVDGVADDLTEREATE